MRFRFLFAVVVAVTLTAMGCSSDSDDAAEVVEQYVAAYNSGDIDAVMAVFTEDSVVYGHPLSPESAGLTEIRAVETVDLAAGASADAYSISNVEVDGDTVTWDHVWVSNEGDEYRQEGQTAVIKNGKILTWTWPAPVMDDTVEAGVVQMYLPASPSTSDPNGPPLIVLIPGGGWETADPTGLIPLAESLAEEGAIVATTTYRASSNGVFFPETVQDVACTIAEAAAASVDAGFEYGEVVVVGHSAGAHLGGLVTLRPDEFVSNCAVPAVAIDRFVGLAGPYDVVKADAVDLFGPQNPDPADWSPGNPIVHAANEPQVDILLVHGMADQTVPTQFTESFAAALEDGSHEVTTSYPESVDHNSVYSSEVASPLIANWLNL